MTIRAGIGGWTYAPWRGVFFPKGLPHARELDYASRHLTSIEINGTFYRTQTPDTFQKWADETPEDFVFAVKAPRYATAKRNLAEAGPSIDRFVASGLDRLGGKLGPINWQFPATKAFRADDVAAFLDLLPRELNGQPLRHALEVRHPSFDCAEFVDMARAAGVAIIFADSEDYPRIESQTADFTYARLMRTRDDVETGYTPEELADWAKRAAAWETGEPGGKAVVGGRGKARGKAKPVTRDVFVYFISGAKVRAPAAATRFLTHFASAVKP